MLATVAALPVARAEPAVVAAAAIPAESACSAGRLTGLQQRLIDKADQGVAPFVQFIHRTRAIYQLNAYQVLEEMPAWRAKGGCRTAMVASADAAER